MEARWTVNPDRGIWAGVIALARHFNAACEILDWPDMSRTKHGHFIYLFIVKS